MTGAVLALVDALIEAGAVAGYQLLHSVRGHMLVELRRPREAGTEFERTTTLTKNARKQARMRERAAACRWTEPSGA